MDRFTSPIQSSRQYRPYSCKQPRQRFAYLLLLRHPRLGKH